MLSESLQQLEALTATLNLRDSERKLSRDLQTTVLDIILEQFPIVVYALDTEGNIIASFGKKALDVVGLKANDVVGLNIFEMHADAPELLAPNVKAMESETNRWTAYVNEHAWTCHSKTVGDSTLILCLVADIGDMDVVSHHFPIEVVTRLMGSTEE